MDPSPLQTVHVANLNTKIKKDELKRQLYALFATYGRVLDIVAIKSDKMRGQAFVVFREVESAAAALRALDAFVFYDKPMKLHVANSVSHVFAKLDGSYWKQQSIKKREGDEDSRKRPRDDEDDEMEDDVRKRPGES